MRKPYLLFTGTEDNVDEFAGQFEDYVTAQAQAEKAEGRGEFTMIVDARSVAKGQGVVYTSFG